MNMDNDSYYDRESMRLMYEPDKIKRLLVAEAPPESLDRFFYYPNVQERDYLFVETMRVLYASYYPDIFLGKKTQYQSATRKESRVPGQIMNDGFYLIDAVDNPIPQSATDRESRKIVRDNLPGLVKKIKALAAKDTGVILIKSSVYDLCEPLRNEGINVINDCMIDFLCCGRRENIEKRWLGL